MNKSGRTRWAGHVTHMQRLVNIQNCSKKTCQYRPAGRYRLTWKDNINIGLKWMVYDFVDDMNWLIKGERAGSWTVPWIFWLSDRTENSFTSWATIRFSYRELASHCQQNFNSQCVSDSMYWGERHCSRQEFVLLRTEPWASRLWSGNYGSVWHAVCW